MLKLRILIAMSVIGLSGCKSDPPATIAATGQSSLAMRTVCPDGSSVNGKKPCPVASVVTTAPVVAVSGAVSTGLDGEAAIADNFPTAGGLEPTAYAGLNGSATGGLPQESADAQGAFRMLCTAGQLLKDDPLVLPNQPGASHLHQFWGNLGASASSTYKSLRTSGQSTCSNTGAAPVNRTAYWMPAMLDGAGHAVKPDLIQTYYKQRPASDPNCKILATACVPIPNGLRYVFGYNMKTMTGGPNDPNATEYWMTRYECWKDFGATPAAADQSVSTWHTMADVVKAGCPAGANLIISFVGPACWDGVNVDTADHRSHVVYQTRPNPIGFACPLDHPYLIPNWSGFLAFTTDANFVAGKWHLSSDEMMPGTIAGSTLHFDYMEAWSPTVKAEWQKGCIDAHKTCASGDLGNGTWIKNDPATRPIHQLVAL